MTFNELQELAFTFRHTLVYIISGFFVWLGYKLLIAGLIDKILILIEGHGFKVNMINASPGIIFTILGFLITVINSIYGCR